MYCYILAKLYKLFYSYYMISSFREQINIIDNYNRQLYMFMFGSAVLGTDIVWKIVFED